MDQVSASMEDTVVADASKGETSVCERKVKRRKPGILYLSSVAPNMTVSQIREYFGQHAEVGRVYMQAAKPGEATDSVVKKHRKSLHYTEGWIEFKSKRKAKQLQQLFNNHPIGGKKRNPYRDMLWNLKYLPRFKWAYLKQRLEYEREVYRQRMGAEISQVRRETDHYIKASEISQKQKKKRNNKEVTDEAKEQGKQIFVFKQKDTEQEILSKKELRKKKNEEFRKRIAEKKKKKLALKQQKPEDDLLSSVFVGSAE